MANQHVVRASAVTLVTTAETVLANLGPFAINQGVPGASGDLRQLQPAQGPGNQGVLLIAQWSITVGTGGTTLTMRVRQNSLTGALVDAALPFTVSAATFYQNGVWLDPTLNYVTGITYVVTGQVTGASANSTVNVITASCEDCTSFE